MGWFTMKLKRLMPWILSGTTLIGAQPALSESKWKLNLGYNAIQVTAQDFTDARVRFHTNNFLNMPGNLEFRAMMLTEFGPGYVGGLERFALKLQSFPVGFVYVARLNGTGLDDRIVAAKGPGLYADLESILPKGMYGFVIGTAWDYTKDENSRGRLGNGEIMVCVGRTYQGVNYEVYFSHRAMGKDYGEFEILLHQLQLGCFTIRPVLRFEIPITSVKDSGVLIGGQITIR
jgi:hypothetical protein